MFHSVVSKKKKLYSVCGLWAGPFLHELLQETRSGPLPFGAVHFSRVEYYSVASHLIHWSELKKEKATVETVSV